MAGTGSVVTTLQAMAGFELAQPLTGEHRTSRTRTWVSDPGGQIQASHLPSWWF